MAGHELARSAKCGSMEVSNPIADIMLHQIGLKYRKING